MDKILGFPAFLVSWAWAFVVTAISDVAIWNLFVATVLFAIVTGEVALVAAIGFAVYALIRALGEVLSGTSTAIGNVAKQINFAARCIRDKEA